jgi:hypothetical protein
LGAQAYIAHAIVWDWPKIEVWRSVDAFRFVLDLLLVAWGFYVALTGRRGWTLKRRRA